MKTKGSGTPTKIVQREAEALACINAAKALGVTKIGVLTSSGKDSVVLVDQVVKSGIDATYINHYIVPNLDVDEEILTSMESRYGIKITRVASPRRADMLNSDSLCINRVWDAVPMRASKSAAFDRMLQTIAGSPWIATGIRITDGPQRALALTRNPNPNPSNSRLYPIATWRKADIWGYIAAEKLPVSRVYALFGRSIDCLNVKHVYPLKAGSPRDYDRIVADFPLMDALCWLYERRFTRGLISADTKDF